MTWQRLPPAARTIAVTAAEAVDAAQTRDRDRFDNAVPALAVLLAGALGVEVADDVAPPPAPAALARHAALLIARLLASAERPLAPYLAAAFTEIERAERQD